MKYLLLFSIAILSSCASTNPKDVEPSVFGDDHPFAGMPSEPGKCYAKCQVANEYKTTKKEVVEYIGDKTTEKVDIKEILLSPAAKGWEKRMADKDCNSSDPEDCMLWCLVDVPAQYIMTLEDTTQSSNWKMTEVEVREIVKKGGYTEWNEVVCNGDLTPQIYRAVKNSLYKLGFDVGVNKDDSSWGREAKLALVTFQKGNDLPIGNFNIPTMDALNIEY